MSEHHRAPLLPLSLLLAALASTTVAAAPAQEAEPLEIVPREWLVLPAVDARGRRPIRPDAVFARYLLEAGGGAPAEGDTLAGEVREAAWKAVTAGEDGRVAGRHGWGYTAVEWPRDEVVMAQLSGAWTLFVNGVGFCGDAYGYGFGGFPVELREGPNHVFVTGVRGGFRLRFSAPPSERFVGGWDVTKPDLRPAENGVAEGELAVVVVNASQEAWSEARLVTRQGRDALRPHAPSPFGLPPLGVAKVVLPFRFEGDDLDGAEYHVAVMGAGGRNVAELVLDLPRVGPLDLFTATFRSPIDGSLQKYSARPASDPGVKPVDLGLVLSCHGAGVDSPGQAAAYAPRPDLWIVCPTNRRPFGFDWQDWGRRNAYLAMEHAFELSGANPARTYLTGHSMGGHGAWHLAANDPERFAAVAPSAGWATFDSYVSRPAGELARRWHEADGAGLTFELVENLAQLPTFVLHGEKDDNVPPSEAHQMIAALKAVGAEPASHFQPGAGHWWDSGVAPGADCLTWPAIYELFAAHRRETAPFEARFKSFDPWIDADHYYLAVHQPLEYGKPFRVAASYQAGDGVLRVETENVRWLRVAAPWEPSPGTYVLDGERIDSGGTNDPAFFVRRGEGWIAAAGFPGPDEKGPARSGPFKRAFENRFLLVYGTGGEPEEGRELLERARFDASCWLYRGNGSAPVVSDREFLAAPAAVTAGRNVILYGNRDTNRAWDAVVPESCPVKARRGAIEIGETRWSADDLCCLFVHPRRGEPGALVGAFADSGRAGTRLGYDLGTFIAGVGIPDLLLFDADVLERGDGGVKAAGWFDREWKWNGGFVQRGFDSPEGGSKSP